MFGNRPFALFIIRAVYTRENKPRLTLNYLYEYKLPGRDKPRVEKAVNVDFVPFIRGVCVLCKPRLIFSGINGLIVCCRVIIQHYQIAVWCPSG